MVTDYHQALNRLLIALLLCWSTDALAQVNWPNEPAGSQVLLDCNFTTATCGGALYDVYGGAYTVNIADAPLSPTSVFENKLDPGQRQGGAQAGIFFPAASELYWGVWWKMSAGFEGNYHDENKMFFTVTGDPSYVYMLWHLWGPTGGPSFGFVWQTNDTRVDNSHLPNTYGGLIHLGNNCQVYRDRWTRIEVYVKKSTTVNSRDGIVRWWIDGQLCGDYTNANWPDGTQGWEINHTWDGGAGISSESGPTKTWAHWFDHVRVSVPNCGAQGCPEPIPDWPNEPTGTTELLDFAFNVTQGSGLDDVNETGVIVSDANAPLSPVNVLQSRLQNGIAPGGVLLQYDLDNLSEMFAGVWWKPNTTFQGLQSGFNRLMGFSQAESPAYLAWVGAQNAGGLSGSIQFYMPLGATAMNNCHLTGWQGNCPGEGRLLPNATACTINATDDTWHRIELYVRRSTSAIDRTGIVRWWVDGNLCGNYDPQAGTGINWGPSGLDYWFWTEAWTATPAGQSADWIHYLDHLYLSRPQGATSVDVMPPGPVTSFTVTIPGGPPPPDPPPVGISPGAEWLQFF